MNNHTSQTPRETVHLDAFIPCSPYHPLSRRGKGRRGLHQLINADDGFEAVRVLYAERFLAACQERGMELGVHYHNPWGRETEAIPVSGQEGQLTGMRLDSKLIADGDREWWWLSARLTESIVKSLLPSTVYTGANPDGLSIASAGHKPMLNLGTDMIFDAAASQIGTPMLSSIPKHNAARRQGVGVALIEANADDYSLPCFAKWTLWGRKGRHSLDKAPQGSRVCFPHGVNEEDEYAVLAEAVTHRVRPVVNLAVTDEVGRVLDIVAVGAREGDREGVREGAREGVAP